MPIEIFDKDLKIDTFRSSGAGGQHVNKTESAVRFTHLPTGIIVACQQERSQHKNRAKAMEMLRAKLYELELKKREAAIADIDSRNRKSAGGIKFAPMFCSPIRWSRTRAPAPKLASPAVLDGDIDMFLQASLASRIKGHVE